MQIQVVADRLTDGNEKLQQKIGEVICCALGRLREWLPRVAVDSNSETGDQGFGELDKRGVILVRAAGLRPITVSHQRAVADQALSGAADRLEGHDLSEISVLQGRPDANKQMAIDAARDGLLATAPASAAIGLDAELIATTDKHSEL